MREEMEKVVNNTPIYQETDEEPVWEVLGGGKDDVFIYDRCGRLAHYIPFPLSLLNKPYVNAGMLSAYFNNPCGVCNGSTSSNSTHLHNNSHSHSHHHHHHSHHHHKRDEMVIDREIKNESGETQTESLYNETTEKISQENIELEDKNKNKTCPHLNLQFCRDWKPKFRLMKTCCNRIHQENPTYRCQSYTPNKCKKVHHLKKCCRSHHLSLISTTMAPELENEQCNDFNDEMCHLLSRLGFTWQTCCSNLQIEGEQVTSSFEMCTQFDARLCYELHTNYLEHSCCKK